MIYIGLLFWSVIALAPFVWMVMSSFKSVQEVLTWPPTLFPESFTFDNYIKAWTLVPYGQYMLNSAIIAGVGTASIVFCSSLAAYSISILKVPGANWIIFIVLLGLIVPVETGFIPVFMMIKSMGLVDTYSGVLLPYLTTSFGVFLLSQFFKVIPAELVDAARIDGLGEFGILRNVVWPLGKPGLITLVVFSFMSIWRDFFWPFLIINKEELRTVPLGVVTFWKAESQHWGQILAVATISMIPLIILYIVFQRHFVKGISWSGLKL